MSERWLWAVRAFKGERLLLETTHATEASKDIEVSAWKTRMRRGEASRVEIARLTSPYGVATLYPEAAYG